MRNFARTTSELGFYTSLNRRQRDVVQPISTGDNDQRFTMAAPSCFVTTFMANLENELPADTEQCPPQALALGLDHSDFLAAMAPKPVIILGKEKEVPVAS